MCLIGLLLPFKHKHESRKHKSKSSGHRRSGHRHSGRSRRDEPRRRDKDESKDKSLLTEDAVARLCLSLEQSLIDEQRRWRHQDRLDRLEMDRLGLEREQQSPPPSEEAPPYSFRDDTAARQPTTPEPQYQSGVADSPACRRDSLGAVYCCRNCICARCGSANAKCPTIPELDDTRVRAFTASGAETRRRRA
ncbi:hypothetical protein C8A00DRAFT_46228 [Chaetomidium leptoderma]|uniref:Uncharacterized protein n=1 Tax=Chaetomidium leptoderma TaxID=669021 RepID=A0AAN6VFX5_9PEZI|nr:hypothetical protein C8A00DRAFT_46228 [Chaetomidium leptoderma]